MQCINITQYYTVSMRNISQPQTGNVCNFSFSACSNSKKKAKKTIYTNSSLHEDNVALGRFPLLGRFPASMLAILLQLQSSVPPAFAFSVAEDHLTVVTNLPFTSYSR